MDDIDEKDKKDFSCFSDIFSYFYLSSICWGI